MIFNETRNVQEYLSNLVVYGLMVVEYIWGVHCVTMQHSDDHSPAAKKGKRAVRPTCCSSFPLPLGQVYGFAILLFCLSKQSTQEDLERWWWVSERPSLLILWRWNLAAIVVDSFPWKDNLKCLVGTAKAFVWLLSMNLLFPYAVRIHRAASSILASISSRNAQASILCTFSTILDQEVDRF